MNHSRVRRLEASSARSSCSVAGPVAGQEGSAYIVTLLVLFVLTALGLSLTLITGNESIMGSQERTIQRTFYAADSGLSLSLAAVMSRNSCESRCVYLQDDDPDLFNASGMIDQLEVSKTSALGDQASNLSQINDSEFRNVKYYVASRATRVAPGDDDIPVGQRTLSQMFALDPWVTPLTCVTDIFVPCSTTSSLTTIPPP